MTAPGPRARGSAERPAPANLARWLLALGLAAAAPASAAEEGQAVDAAAWSWLPSAGLFRLPLADTRSPLSTITLRTRPEIRGAAIDVSLAEDIRVGALELGEAELQLGVAGAIFMGFAGRGEWTFDFLTFDGYFAFPLDIRWRDWGARLQLAHISAHTADGVDINPPDPPAVEGAISFEYLQLLAGPARDGWRIYAGPRMTTHAVHDAERWQLQIGGEIAAPRAAAPFAAVDLKVDQTWGWTPTVAVQAGGLFYGGRQRFRVALVAYRGMEDTGKLQGREERYVGLLTGFGGSGDLTPPPAR